MRYPEFLKAGGSIGFLAPAFGCATEPYHSAFERAISVFEAEGYGIVKGPNVYKCSGIGISASPKECAAELNMMFEGEGDALISCGGGELMCEILPFIDFERLSRSCKWFMGYSDNTNITFLLNTVCDMAAIYGPCAAAFGQKPWHESIRDAFSLLKGEALSFSGYDKWELRSLKSEDNPFATYNTTEDRRYLGYMGNMPLDNISMRGRLLGGCLDCLANLVGTAFDHVSEFNARYGDDGIVWFLESCDLNAFDVRRRLWQLKNAGWFEKAAGFIIGRPYHFNEECMGLDMYKAALGILGDMEVPIIMDADLGHLPPQIPVISGSLAEVSLKGLDYHIRYLLE